MAAIDSTVSQLWQTWMNEYKTASTKEGKETALANLQALDLWDDGKKNNSIDASFDAWDIQDLPKNEKEPMTDQEAEKKFDKWWSQLPADVQEELTNKYAGENREFSIEEKREVNDHIASVAGWEDELTPEEIDSISAGLDDKDSTVATNKKYETWMAQLPEDVRKSIESTFGDGKNPLNDEQKKEAVDYMQSKGNGDDKLSDEEIAAIKGGLDKPDNKDEINKKYDTWMKQLPEDVRKSIETTFGDGKNPLNDEQKKQAVEYMGSKGDWDDTLSKDEIAGIKGGLNKPDNKDETNKKYETWMKQLPEDVRKSVEAAFGDGKNPLNDEQKKQAVEYMGSKGDWDDKLTDDEIAGIKGGLNKPDNKDETNKKYDTWMKQLPEDVRKSVEATFGDGKNPLNDEQKKQAVEYMASKGDWDDKLTDDEIADIKSGLDKPDGTEETNRKFNSWWWDLPADVRQTLSEKFGGPDGIIYADEEKKAAVEYLGGQAGWSDRISEENLQKIRKDLGMPDTTEETNKQYESWMQQLPPYVRKQIETEFGGKDGGPLTDEEKKKAVDYLASKAGWGDKLSSEDIDRIKNETGRPDNVEMSNKKFQTWWDKLPEDVRKTLEIKFGGADGKVNSDEEKG